MSTQAAKNKVVHISESKPPIELRYIEKDRNVIVKPDDAERFTMTVEETIRACQLNKKVSEFNPIFNRLLQRLALWIKKHAEKIDDAYITVRDACLFFVVVQKMKTYDRQFEDVLTELDLSIARDTLFADIRLNVLAIPKTSPEAILTFLNPTMTLKYSDAQ